MKFIGTFLVGVAVLLQIGGFILYDVQVFSNATLPNTTSWLLWAYLSILNALTYYHDSSKNWTKSGVAIINAIAMVITFIFSVSIGNMSLPPMHDYPVLVLGLLAGLAWYRYSAGIAQVVLQFAFTLAFLPTYFDIWDNPSIEHPLPWLLWATSFFLGIVIVGTKWRGRYIEIMYPAIAFLRVGGVIILLRWSPFFHSLVT